MKVVIAPSKTMKYTNYNFIPQDILFVNETNYLHSILKQYRDEELCELMKISYKQAVKVHEYFNQPQNAYPALSLYQGTVFKQLNIAQYHDHLSYLLTHVNILSAYYGVLNYNSAIFPYRLDMTMKPNDINLYEYWYTPVYKYFKDEDFIISLASKEFTSMIHHPHLYFIDFVSIKKSKEIRSSMLVKKLRGKMLNMMILNEITSLEEIKQLNIDGFTFNADKSHDHQIVFSSIVE